MVSELDPGTRTPEEMAHQWKVGPLDRADWPTVGDEVLYHHPEGGWVAATVVEVADHDGDLCLSLPDDDVDAYDAKHGPHRHGWLLYGEAAQR